MRVDTKASQLQFVYPFTYDPGEFGPCVDCLQETTWSSRKSKLQLWNSIEFPEDELVPSVARYLNPPAEIDDERTACLLTISPVALESSSCLGAGANSSVRWFLEESRIRIPFRMERIQLALFQVGVGFLTFTARPVEQMDRVETWLDFLHYFRFARGQRDVTLVAERRTRKPDDAQEPNYSPFFPELAGGLDRHPEGRGVLGDLIDGLLSTAAPEGRSGVWWRDPFIPGTLVPYVVLYVDGIGEEEIPSLAYRLRNFFRSDKDPHAAVHDLSPEHRSLLAYADRQWFFFSLNGGGFLACDAPATQFFRATLPDHLQVHYYLTFLLALQQRFALMLLSEQVAEKWLARAPTIAGDNRQRTKEEAFEGIRDQLLAFTARGYFAQAMQREAHHRCYQRWQETFQIARLYQEVRDAVRYMHDSAEADRERHTQRLEEASRKQTQELERRLSLIAWLIGVPALVLSLLDAVGPVSLRVAILSLLGSLALGLLIYRVLMMLTRPDWKPGK